MKNPKLYLIFIVLLAAILRFWQLGSIPRGIVDDEAKYIYSAYSIWETGNDIEDKHLPLSFNLDTSLSPVPVYLMAPVVGLFGVSAFSGRILMALSGVGSVLLLYFLTKKIFDNEWIGILSAFFLAISSWDIIVSRSAFEANLALFFYLLAIVIFLYKTRYGSINWSLPAFLLAFYSYHATKVFFIVCIPLLIFLYRKELFQRKKELSFFITGCIVIIFSFFLVMKFQGVSRSSELFWNNDRVAQESKRDVNQEREHSSGPRILKQLYNNKVLYDLDLIVKNYLHAFSPQILFTQGEESFISGSQHFFSGVFSLPELCLLVFGIAYVFVTKKKANALFISTFILISPLPSALSSGQEYLLRSIMLLPFLSLLIGAGCYYLFILFKRNQSFLSYLLLSVFVLLHLFFVTRFFYQYFNQFGQFGGEFWQQSAKELSEFIANNQSKYDSIDIVQLNSNFLLEYAIYNQLDPRFVQKTWKQNEKRDFGNIKYFAICFNQGKGDPKELLPSKTLYIVPQECYPKIKPDYEIVDSFEPLHTIWKIYEIH